MVHGRPGDRSADGSRVEKYRPRLLKDIVGNEEIVQRLEVIAQTGNMPHMLLAVPFPPKQHSTNVQIGPTWHWQDDEYPLFGY